MPADQAHLNCKVATERIALKGMSAIEILDRLRNMASGICWGIWDEVCLLAGPVLP